MCFDKIDSQLYLVKKNTNNNNNNNNHVHASFFFLCDFGISNNCVDERFEGNNTKPLSLFVIEFIFE